MRLFVYCSLPHSIKVQLMFNLTLKSNKRMSINYVLFYANKQFFHVWLKVESFVEKKNTKNKRYHISVRKHL